MSVMDITYVDGGHVYWEKYEEKWVAVNYVAVLGRFDTKKEALEAVSKDFTDWKRRSEK